MERLETSVDAMGSTFSIILYGHGQKRMEEAAGAAFEEVQRLDEMLSNYRQESEWSVVNRCAAHQPVKISTELFQFLSRCQECSRRSDGAFDISVGPLLKAWGFYRGTGRLPAPEEIACAQAAVGYRKIHLDPALQTVRFEHPGVEIDPGGIGKGYTVDAVVDILKRRCFNSALIVGSGSSIYGLGTPPGEPKGWQVDICSPKNPRKIVEQAFLNNMSISTSGRTEKFFWAEGRLYSHILDPRTGYPAQGISMVSVVALRAVDSEAWTKPCLINGRQWTAMHKPKDFRVFFCEESPEKACSWLD